MHIIYWSYDNESEKIVQKALDSVSSDKTVLSIAHRLTSIQDYDEIIVMQKGLLDVDVEMTDQ